MTHHRHNYLSTACYHGKHQRCDKRCRFCRKDCICMCHGERKGAMKHAGGRPPRNAQAMVFPSEA